MNLQNVDAKRPKMARTEEVKQVETVKSNNSSPVRFYY